jgi:hypothetical protein
MSAVNQKLVLKHKKSGKQSSARDQLNLAAILLAVEMTATGKGGGISSLLIPKTPAAQSKISRVAAIYRPQYVKSRNGKQPQLKNVREQLRDYINNDTFVCCLALLFEKSYSSSTSTAHQFSVKAFKHWFDKQITIAGSPIKTLLRQRAPLLLESPRGLIWWRRAFSARKKRRVNVIL